MILCEPAERDAALLASAWEDAVRSDPDPVGAGRADGWHCRPLASYRQSCVVRGWQEEPALHGAHLQFCCCLLQLVSQLLFSDRRSCTIRPAEVRRPQKVEFLFSYMHLLVCLLDANIATFLKKCPCNDALSKINIILHVRK